ncbi:Subtilisin inhibitor-like protein 1 [Streptomonospora litoralis]|uniref:Subtilisin inhibitor-like protein 1 n=1 Tax=Streptomonospora litoralis TaxID=2498135 RepID=A0A4P6PUY3_9ACTN|nr:Subtilisin inhibitor-like protein 1 [Streptomonospora litoralis]
MPVALLAALGLAAAGCGPSEVRTPPEPTPADASPSSSGTGRPAETVLTIDITTVGSAAPSGAADPSPVPSPSPTDPKHWRLTCHPAGGDHPAPEAACADLADAGGAEAFEEVPENSPCTFIYGGPQVARVQGHVGGESIDTELTKADGCEMQRYEDLGAVLAP